MPREIRLARWALAFAALLVGRGAAAQTSATDAAAAQALFEDGKRLMVAGKYAEACPKLAESQRLDPGGGTIYALALCHEGEGKTATAWAEFSLAATEARKDRRADREKAALERIKKLEARLVKIRVVVTGAADGLEIRRNGVLLGAAQWSTPLPVDPGEYKFDAQAPKKKPWSTTVTAREEGKTVDVQVPALEDEPVAPAPPPPKPNPAADPLAAAPPPPKPSPEPPRPRSKDYTAAYLVGGLGLAATAVGVFFGLSATSKWSDAEKACPNNTCPAGQSITLGEDAGRAADLSTVFFVIGAAGLVAGGVLFFTASPSSSNAASVRVAPAVSRDGAGLRIGGAF
jgi:hypothetical protein